MIPVSILPMPVRVGTLLSLGLAVGLSACGGATGDAAAEPELQSGAITHFTDSTELFMEHPALIVGEAGKFAVHLTDLTDFAPLRSGRLTLRFTPRGGGAPLEVVQEAPRVPGIYGPAPVFTAAGTYDLELLVDSPQAKDRIEVPGLVVYATAADAPTAAAEEDAGIPFLKEQQWKTAGFATAFARDGNLAISFEAPAEVRAAAGRHVAVVAPAGGLLSEGTIDVALGARVRRGQVLALVSPTLGASGATFADARARWREAEDEFARAKRLFAAEAIPERRVHEAEIRLAATREALAAVGGGAVTAEGRVEVVAPIDGVIADRSMVAGARVEPGTSLFTIVDASVVWVVIHVPTDRIASLDRTGPARFRVEGSDEPVIATRLLATSGVVDTLTRSIPVTYAVDNATGTLRIGAIARAAVPTVVRGSGVIIAAAALLEEDGRSYVYVQTSGERFARREVTVAGLEGTRALITSGLAAGDRVVTGAAYQVRLASLSTAVPAHGHEH
ncbi:MAG: efflux RND transporter periplasmic adaptor subunit [Gemmatimonadota bacterium]|nr:efflux RND transporter periplasmic adaptor subunit [Gemmatimonadota bacterium]MDQ8152902.1 efflux RND transporter periplasmic adaptor subunit [Gemmatimonadota bacterium]